MEAKEIISELILGKITVSQALQLTLLYYETFLSKESKAWITDEINGYKNSSLVPEYRLLDCTLKLEVYDTFSNLHLETLDTSNINSYLEKDGYESYSPNKMRISQNIESIEKTQAKESSNISMCLKDGLKRMVLDCYQYSPNLRFGRLYQECPSEYINVVIAKVKAKLFSILQSEVLKNEVKYVSGKTAKKQIFISYSWEDNEHKAWVHKLAEILGNYFNIKIDVKVPLGSDINTFMERMIAESDRVLLILTPTYKQKADARENGVGYESVLISDEVYQNQNSIKFVPIIRKGSKETSFPRYLGNRKGVVMTDDTMFDDNILLLIDDLSNN